MKHEILRSRIRDEDVKVSRQVFDDTNELVKYIKKAPINEIWRNERKCSEREKEKGFNDFNTLGDAIFALEYGTDIYYENFQKDIKNAKDFVSKHSKNKNQKFKNDRVGYLPIVPKVLQGNPVNMINQDIKKVPFPTAKIIIEKSNSCCTEEKDMSAFYSIVFVLIQMLEEKGIRCEVWVTDNSCEQKEIINLQLKLKSYTQPLNLYKIQFPIIASDFHRRIYFRIKETNPDIKNSMWTWGYGTPILREYDYIARREEIHNIAGVGKNDIYIPSCEFFEYSYKNDIGKTIKKIIEKTNFKNYIKLTE